MAITPETRPRGATVQLKDPRTLKVMPGLNARDMNSLETKAHVAAIADSIEAQGFLGSHPLETFWEGGETYIAAGHCRLAACMLVIERGVDLQAVPCLAESRGTSQEQRLLNQITSNSGQRLNLAEEGKVYHRLAAMGWATSKIAEKAGRSEAHIRQALDFLAAPQEAHELVSAGKVSATLAAKTIRQEGGEAGVRKLNAAVETAEKAGKTKATAKHVEPREPREPKPPKAKPEAAVDNTMSALSLARRIMKRGDPRDFDAAEAMKCLIQDYKDALAVFAEPVREAAE